jgi:hypothetical protein
MGYEIIARDAASEVRIAPRQLDASRAVQPGPGS